jgi:5'-nucleotidase
MHILLTNDDSYDSPLFHILYDILIGLGHKLTCIIPATEQSWTGKSMTRLGRLTVNEREELGRSFTTFSGTPADCINFGLHNYCEEKPDIVFSGINLGYNASLGFVFSSGTIGGALEAYLAGFPAISFSQKLTQEDYKYWNNNRNFPQDTKEKYTDIITKVINKITAKMVSIQKNKELWSVEIPDHLDSNWELRITKPSLQHYGSTFAKAEDGTFFHTSSGLDLDDITGTDVHAIANGHVAMNKLDFKGQFKK